MSNITWVKNRYPIQNELIQKLDDVMQNYVTDRWYNIYPLHFCYKNARGYYHVVILSVHKDGYSCLDYLVKTNGKLEYANKNWNFKNKTEFEDYLKKYHGFTED